MISWNLACFRLITARKKYRGSPLSSRLRSGFGRDEVDVKAASLEAAFTMSGGVEQNADEGFAVVDLVGGDESEGL